MRRGPSLGAFWAVLALFPSLLVSAPANKAQASPTLEPGEQVWAADYPLHSTDMAMSLDGSRVYLVGPTGGAPSLDFLTLAIDAQTGTEVWRQVFDGPEDPAPPAGNTSYSNDSPQSVVVSPDGSRVYVTGQSQWWYPGGYPPSYSYATVAYDASTGSELWIARYEDGGYQRPSSTISPDGSLVIVTGDNTKSVAKYATVAYDSGTGNQVWEALSIPTLVKHTGPANALAVSPDGKRLFVTSTVARAYIPRVREEWGLTTIAYNTRNGKELWVANYDGPGRFDSHPIKVAMSPDASRVYVTASSLGEESDGDYVTIGYDARTGVEAWVSRYNGPANGRDEPSSISVSPDGAQVYITGFSESAEVNAEFATVSYDARDGKQLWVSRYIDGSLDDGSIDGSSGASADHVAVGPDGTVFVTGYSDCCGYSSGYGHAVTLAYAPENGTTLWTARYGDDGDPPSSPRGFKITMRPDRKVIYVAGDHLYGRSSGLSFVAAYAGVPLGSPSFERIPAQKVSSLQELTLTISAMDPDGDALDYSARNLPPNARFDPATRVFSWIPRSNDVGWWFPSFKVVDSTGLLDEMYVAIEVKGVLLGLGDSVASGWGFGKSDGYPNNDQAYPSLIARALRMDVFNYSIGGACAATRGKHGAHPDTPSSWNGNPKCQKSVLSDQLDDEPTAMAGIPSIITLTVGADDIVFAECFRALFDTQAPDPCTGAAFARHLDAFEHNLNLVLETLTGRYPDSEIRVTQYYNPLPPPPASDSDICDAYYPIVFQKSPDLLATPALFKEAVKQTQAQTYLFAEWVLGHLNGRIQTVTQRWGRTNVPLNFLGHDMCRTRIGGTVDDTWVFGPKVNYSYYWSGVLFSGSGSGNIALPDPCPDQSHESSLATQNPR